MNYTQKKLGGANSKKLLANSTAKFHHDFILLKFED